MAALSVGSVVGVAASDPSPSVVAPLRNLYFRIIRMEFEIEEEEGKGSTYQYPVGHGPCHAQPSRWVRDGHRTPFFSSRVLRRKKCYHYSF